MLGQRNWRGVSYVKVCERASKTGDEFGKMAMNGIRKVFSNEADSFYLEYPCHSKEEKRWFMMRVSPLALQSGKYFLVSHQNITERKLAEEKVMGLSNIANRRHFDQFLEREYRRCKRTEQLLSLLFLDVDYFKAYNDYYGHIEGDDCLRTLANVLESYARRPGDMAARYGGEEFALVLGNTDLEEACRIGRSILVSIREFSNQA